jgi:phage-related protein
MADLKVVWNWSFLGYEAPSGNRPVQEWFDGLADEVKDEARDAIGYLQHSSIQQWSRPHFEKLEDGISEVRFRVSNVRYRIYGYFATEVRQSYTFLHGTHKKVSNDRKGKKTAKDRMGEIGRKEARTHKFEFENGPDSASAKK